MRASEAAKIVAMVAQAYSSPAWSLETQITFAAMLEDLDAPAAEVAAISWIKSRKERPTVADLRSAVREQLERAGILSRDPDGDEAWGEVMDAMRTYGRTKPFESMHKGVTEAVNRIGWINLCNSETIGYERAQFAQFYRAYLLRRRDEIHSARGLLMNREAISPAIGHGTDQPPTAGDEVDA